MSTPGLFPPTSSGYNTSPVLPIKDFGAREVEREAPLRHAPTVIDIDSDSDVPQPSNPSCTATVIVDTLSDTETVTADCNVQAAAIVSGGGGGAVAHITGHAHGDGDNDERCDHDKIADESNVACSPSQPSKYMFWPPPAPNDTTN